MASPFRFVTSRKRGEYSVWRGEATRLGFVTQVTHRVYDRGVEHKRISWTPTTEHGKELSAEKTQKAAAEALWRAYQAHV